MNIHLKALLSLVSDKKPLSVTYIISRNCNLRCKQCNIWKNPRRDPLTLKQKLSVIDKLFAWLGNFQLNISGGEPFVHPHTIKILEKAARKKIKIYISTNGTLLSKRVLDKLAKYKKYIFLHVSFDGYNSKTHDYLRGKDGTFTKIVDNIKYWKNIKKGNFSMSAVISQYNVSYLTKLCDLAIDLGADGMNFQPLDLYSFSNSKNSLKEFKTHRLWPKDYSSFKNEFNKLIVYKKSKNGNIIKNTVEELEGFLNYFKNPFDKKQKCGDTKSLMVYRNGDVSLCSNIAFKFGNVMTDDLNKIYNSKARNDLQIQKLNCNLPCKLLSCNRKRDFKYYKNLFLRKVQTKFSDCQK